jgi:protection of telomeres protein 1
MRLSTLSDILNAPERQIKTPEGIQVTLPFLNAKWRARVRVVDFSPRELEDFARCFDTEEITSAGLPDPYETDPSSLPNNGWEWAFYLLVEDAKPPKGEKPTQMALLVNNHRGQGLLKMDACKYVSAINPVA